MAVVVLHGPSFDPLLPQVTPEAVSASVNAVIPPMVKGQIVTTFGSMNQSLFVGVNAGASYDVTNPADSFGSVGFGPGALQSLTQIHAENVAVGAWSAQYVTTGQAITAVGMHAAGHEDTGNGHTALGNDAMRHTISHAGGVTAVGGAAVLGGNPGVGTVGVGQFAMRGHSGAIILSGTKTTGDVLTIALVSANPSVSPTSVTLNYTVLAGDTMTTIANALAALLTNCMSGPSNFLQGEVQALPNGTIAVSLQYPGSTTTGWLITVTPSTSGGATEILTLIPAAAGTAITVVGQRALQGAAMNGAVNITAIGTQAGQFVTSASHGTMVGAAAGGQMMTSVADTYVGSLAGQLIQTGADNTFVGGLTARTVTSGTSLTIIGARAGNAMTSAPSNVTMLGRNVGSATFATGTDVILIGSGSAAVDTPLAATSHYINIQNILTVTGTDVPATSKAVLAGGLGVWGHAAPAAKPATPVTLADVIAAMQAYGLVA